MQISPGCLHGRVTELHHTVGVGVGVADKVVLLTLWVAVVVGLGISVGGDGFISTTSQVPGRSQAPRKRTMQLAGVSATQCMSRPGHCLDSVRQRIRSPVDLKEQLDEVELVLDGPSRLYYVD